MKKKKKPWDYDFQVQYFPFSGPCRSVMNRLFRAAMWMIKDKSEEPHVLPQQIASAKTEASARTQITPHLLP